MKLNAVTVGVAGLLMMGLSPQGPYAPKLPIPDKLPDDPAANLMVMAVRNASVPSATDVGIAAYPGARIISAMQFSDATSNDEEVKMLPGVALLATDDVAAVAAFYKERLDGWDYEEFYGTHMFWNGPEGSNPMDITGQFPMISILSLEESGTERAIWTDMRTRIDIRYVPGGK